MRVLGRHQRPCRSRLRVVLAQDDRRLQLLNLFNIGADALMAFRFSGGDTPSAGTGW
jgi:hypothetical protein